MKLSIVIPVYNVENTLERCLQSVCQRLIPNFEIILINDGSTDKSLAICKRYASNYVNIRIFNQENHGLSYARNKGIEECFSEYITRQSSVLLCIPPADENTIFSSAFTEFSF